MMILNFILVLPSGKKFTEIKVDFIGESPIAEMFEPLARIPKERRIIRHNMTVREILNKLKVTKDANRKLTNEEQKERDELTYTLFVKVINLDGFHSDLSGEVLDQVPSRYLRATCQLLIKHPSTKKLDFLFEKCMSNNYKLEADAIRERQNTEGKMVKFKYIFTPDISTLDPVDKAYVLSGANI